MLTYHKKYKTTQHKIGERKESPQITINKKKKKKSSTMSMDLVQNGKREEKGDEA